MTPRSSRRRTFSNVHWVAGALALAALATSGTPEAHKAITSPYMYNEHVFPIFRDRCGACHYPGGPTPMSLLSYKDAIPWAESMREQLVGERMPPWFVDPLGPGVRGTGHTLTTKELDVVVTWAVGGTPQGDQSTDPPPYVPPTPGWSAGAPDLELKMPAAHTLAAGTMEEEAEVTIPTGLKEDRWVKAIDLMPGERSMVRDAVVAVANGPVLGAWVPGHEVVTPPSGAAFKLPAGAQIQLRMYYKKHYLDEQNAKSDQSTIGFYFTDPPLSGRGLQSLALSGGSAASSGSSAESDAPRIFNGTLASGGRIVAIRPTFDAAYTSVAVDAIVPGGRRTALLRLRSPQPQWHRRYWLADPIEVPKGTRLEVIAAPAPPDDFAIGVQRRYPFQVGVEFIAP